MTSSDSEDEDLLMAAGHWAEQNEDDDEVEQTPQATNTSNWDEIKRKKRDKTKPVKEENVKSKTETVKAPVAKNFSLHLTKVPFDASQSTIRHAFTAKKCQVLSVRLVYDTDPNTRERSFRGVAFVDLADEVSFNIGLKLHNTSFLGTNRKVNVRPTKTRSELSAIVKKTEERVAMLIARSKEKKRAREEEGNGAVDERGSAKKKRLKRNKKKKDKSTEQDVEKNAIDTNTNNKNSPNTNQASSKKKRDEGSPKSKQSKSRDTKKREGNKSDATPTKLTKKQRAQKAAVIRNLASKFKK